MDERRAVEVLRELRKHGDIADWWELDAALDHAIATIERERWRPIAEAPKDGLPLLLWEAGQAFIGYRGADFPDDAAVDRMGTACYPSHWLPLPDPQPDGQEGT